jgi:serine/threonine-protein kinase
VVYRARQLTVDREVAIKVLAAHASSDPQWITRFQNEARAAARLTHPNTVRLIDSGQAGDGQMFIAMELLQGRSLRAELERVGKLSPERALRIITQACHSVAEAHTQGIIHRDLKPDNLYLCDMKGGGDFVKVLDFSVAKLVDSKQTRTGTVFGTPPYMSPEQGSGGTLGPPSDVYALGIVLYEMLSGRPPFDSKIAADVLLMHLKNPVPPIAGLPPPVERLILRALEKHPGKRPPTCESFADECEAVYEELFGPPASGAHRIPGSPGTGRQRLVDAPPPVEAPRPARAPEPVVAAPAPARVASAPQGTVMLDAHQGVGVQALVHARAAVAAEAAPIEAPRSMPLGFWIGWTLIGLGLGLGVHVLRLHLATG